MEKNVLKEQYKYMKMNVPWNQDLVINGMIDIVIECDPKIRLNLPMDFKTNENGRKHQYIGQVPKEVFESKCGMKITLDIKHINAFHMRIYLDFHTYHNGICNGTVKVGDDVFHICKEILCYNSKVFYKLFQASSDIELTDFSSQDFRRVLNLIYPSQLVPYSWLRKYKQDGKVDCIERLLTFAGKYEIVLIKDIISFHITDVLFCHDVAWLTSLNERHNMPSLSKWSASWKCASYLKAFRHPEIRKWSTKTRICLFDMFMDQAMWDKEDEEGRLQEVARNMENI